MWRQVYYQVNQRLIMAVQIEFDIWINLACRGAVVIDGFSSVGTVSTLVASHLVDALAMEQIGVVNTQPGPPLSMIRNGIPHEPMRIYAIPENHGNRELIVFLSEMLPAPELMMPLGRALVRWCLTHGCPLLISPEGVPAEPTDEPPYGIGSTASATALLARTDCRPLHYGTISGITSVLLSFGREMRFDVVALLAESHADYPDARAAARVLGCLNPLLPTDPVDEAALLAKAGIIEAVVAEQQAEEPAEEEPREAPEGLYT